MNSNKYIRYLNWDMLGSAAFFSYCLSTVFMIFFSTAAVQFWPYPLNRLSILTVCLAPLLLVLVWKIPEWIAFRELRKELLFIPIVVTMGILNIVFSASREVTLKSMTLFLISGIGIFGVTSCLLNTKSRQKAFLWLCMLFLLALCVSGFLEYFSVKVTHLVPFHTESDKYSVYLFSYNPLPGGALLILLFPGPLILFLSSSKWLRFLEMSTIVFCIVLIVIFVGKRGPILGLLAIALLLGFLLKGRKGWSILLIAFVVIAVGFILRNHLPATLRKNFVSSKSSLNRLEHYFFAAHVFSKKPLFGIGLHAPLERYLPDYRQRIKLRQAERRYPRRVKRRNTLENILLCSLVEMGSFFLITYVVLIMYLLRNVFRHVRERPVQRLKAIALLAPLFGFFVHSMTFDSLMFPQLNWLFHSYLGLMANFSET